MKLKNGLKWKHCPECGSNEVYHPADNSLGDGYRVCIKCKQEWWTDIDYSDRGDLQYYTQQRQMTLPELFETKTGWKRTVKDGTVIITRPDGKTKNDRQFPNYEADYWKAYAYFLEDYINKGDK